MDKLMFSQSFVLSSCLKVDCGNKRAGVQSEDAEAVNIVAFIHQHPRQVGQKDISRVMFTQKQKNLVHRC